MATLGAIINILKSDFRVFISKCDLNHSIIRASLLRTIISPLTRSEPRVTKHSGRLFFRVLERPCGIISFIHCLEICTTFEVKSTFEVNEEKNANVE